MKPIMALDYGSKRIGVAISDELHLLAHPLETIKNDEFAIENILRLIKERNVGKIIIGFPKWDKVTPIGEEILQFSEKLKMYTDVEIEFVNEFYSSKIAVEKLVSTGKKFKKYKRKLDVYAACIILQDYLDMCKSEL
ncbi:MAG: Holliday junction resolvase RuvX [Elusimicrobiota bacterium]|nr:Holliday junction resolvase RuvX [Endomicrobiia bacterium]MDW8055721.1 Holliday junction resolvase RuvX [Elusimicrobiota bacterium]